MLDQEQMLKELVSMIEGLGKKSAKKVEDPYKGSSIQKGIAGNPKASQDSQVSTWSIRIEQSSHILGDPTETHLKFTLSP